MKRSVVLLILLKGIAAAQSRQVAITIDDLPRGGDGGGRDLASVRAMTEKLLDPLRGIPLIGFVNAGRAEQLGDEGLQTILRKKACQAPGNFRSLSPSNAALPP